MSARSRCRGRTRRSRRKNLISLLRRMRELGVTLEIDNDGKLLAMIPGPERRPDLGAEIGDCAGELLDLLGSAVCPRCRQPIAWPRPVGIELPSGEAVHVECRP